MLCHLRIDVIVCEEQKENFQVFYESFYTAYYFNKLK